MRSVASPPSVLSTTSWSTAWNMPASLPKVGAKGNNLGVSDCLQKLRRPGTPFATARPASPARLSPGPPRPLLAQDSEVFPACRDGRDSLPLEHDIVAPRSRRSLALWQEGDAQRLLGGLAPPV